MTKKLPDHATDQSCLGVFLVFLRLGLTSFGGPIAHLSYFRQECVDQRHWLSEARYAELVALCQFLPGPASSQVGMALGLMRAGYGGAVAAWAGFTLPSAVLMIAFALSLSQFGHLVSDGVLYGLKWVVVAVVAQAVWGMARTLCTNVPRMLLMLMTAVLVSFFPAVGWQLLVLMGAGLIGALCFRPNQAKAPAANSLPETTLKENPDHSTGNKTGDPVSNPVSNPIASPVFSPIHRSTYNRRTGTYCLGLFVLLLVGLPVMSHGTSPSIITVLDAFYRTGALVFGGGHVVLPLLQAEVVTPGWISNTTFLTGYAAAQGVPGPLFSFAAFLGASMPFFGAAGLATTGPGTAGFLSAWLGGMVCLLAIFTPSFLLIFGVLPYWERIRHLHALRAALQGINAAVVGLLLAALIHPVASSAIASPNDALMVTLAVIALMRLHCPPWFLVLLGGITGWLVA